MIKYLLKRKSVNNEDQSIDSFFSNGISFPVFITKILSIASIPNIKQKPVSKSDCEYNNNTAFQFLLKCCDKINSQNPKFTTKEDKIQLLKLIITTKCFQESSAAIIKKLNLIFDPLNYSIKDESDLYNFKTISSLLHIYTNGLFPITNSFKRLYNYCAKTDIPLIINESALESQNSDLFLIQIQIFFDFFSSIDQKNLDLINVQIQKNSKSKLENKPKDQSKSSPKTKNKSKDQTESSSKTKNKQEDQTESPQKNKNKSKDQAESSSKTKNKQENQTESSSKTKNKSKDQAESSKTKTESKDQTESSSKTKTKPEDQTESSSKTKTKPEDQTESSQKTKNKSKDQAESSKTKTESKDQTESSKTKTESKDQTESSSKTKTKSKDQTESSSKTKTKSKDQTESSQKTKNKTNKSKSVKLNKNDTIQNDTIGNEFWNHSPDIYSYFNGILISKSIRPDYYNFDQSERKFVNQNNLFQIFKYDEPRCCWHFCEKEFDKLNNLSGHNAQIPLVLFMNTYFNNIINFLSIFNNNIHEYDFGEDISAFLFCQESTAELQERKFFFFIYIPESKTKQPNIRIIFYQIYTFLFLICDISIIIIDDLNNDLYLPQFNFVLDVIKISDLYLKNTKKSTGEKLFRDHSQIFFNIVTNSNNSDDLSNDSNASKLRKHIIDDINQKAKKNIKKKYQINNQSFSVHATVDELKCILLNDCYHFSELKEIFVFWSKKFNEISELYLFTFIDIRNEDQPNFIRSIINSRFNILYNAKIDTKSIIDIIKKEALKFYPKCDFNFSSIFEKELLQKALDIDQFEKNIIIQKLNDISNKKLMDIDRIIKEKGHLNEEQSSAIKIGHQIFLQENFFEIIKANCNYTLNIAFEKLNDVLQSQIQKDDIKISQILDANSTQKNQNESTKFDDESKKSCNYVIKEVEQMKEIEVYIDSDENLENIITQDF